MAVNTIDIILILYYIIPYACLSSPSSDPGHTLVRQSTGGLGLHDASIGGKQQVAQKNCKKYDPECTKFTILINESYFFWGGETVPYIDLSPQ